MRRLKKEKGFFEEGVINETAMLAYLNHELSTEEQQQFERLLKADPFAQDALEGLQNAQNKVAVPVSISAINKKIRERAGLKEKKPLDIHWTNYAWAAVLIGLLIGIGFVMVNYVGKPGQSVAMKQEEKMKSAEESLIAGQNETPELKQGPVSTGADLPQVSQQGKGGNFGLSDSISLHSSKLISSNGTGAVDDKQFKVGDIVPVSGTKGKEGNYANTSTSVGLTTSTMNSTIVASDGNMMGTATPPTAAPVYQFSTNQDVSKKDQGAEVSQGFVSITENSSQLRAEQKENKNAKVSASKGVVRGSIMEREEADKTTTLTLSDAMGSFNSGDYKKSSGQFDALLSQQPSNADALYYGGISDYILGNTKKSEKNFDKLLKDGTKFIDGSKWYKANILLMKGKREEAKKLLDDLSQSSGSYKERAVKRKADVGL